MSMTDPIADLLTRIRNAQSAGKADGGRGRLEAEAGHPQGAEGRGLHRRLRRRCERARRRTLSIELKYHDGRPVIDRIERISRPGLRIYRGKDELPKVLGGLGVAVSRPPRASCPTSQARAAGTGGEVLFVVDKDKVAIMSRVAKKPVDLPQGVQRHDRRRQRHGQGRQGLADAPLKSGIKVVQQDKHLEVRRSRGEGLNAIAGATRAHLANMVTGVTKGYEKKLELVGVGYRAAVQAKSLTLTLGYSHLINYRDPRRHHHRDAEPDRDPRQGHRSPARRPDRGRDPRLPAAGALQGQGREVFGREDFAERSEEEVGP